MTLTGVQWVRWNGGSGRRDANERGGVGDCSVSSSRRRRI